MRYDKNSNCIFITAGELASFAFQRENPALLTEKYGFVKKIITAPDADVDSESTLTSAEHGKAIHNALETEAKTYTINISSDQSEVPLEKRIMYGEYTVAVVGYADIISYNGIIHTVEEIKTLAYFPDGLCPFSNPAHFAQAVIYACIYAETQSLPEVNIRLTYIKRSGGGKVTFTAPFSRINLTRMFEALLSRAYPIITAFSDRYRTLPGEIKSMPFPYKAIREGQLEFVNAQYLAVKKALPLLVSAPTGIGKTISALFPSLKAVGAGFADKIFYLTAKNVTGKAAVDALTRITKYAPHLRSVMICAKELMCPYRKKGAEMSNCRMCDRMDSTTEDFGKTYISYRERETGALEGLLLGENKTYSLSDVMKAAEEHKVCPYELALDLSESCTVVICDYNYVIDDNVRFKRYFKNPKADERYVFLFDEAHNLPDRTRSTYSAEITSKTADELLRLSETTLAAEGDFVKSAAEFHESMDGLREMCTESEYCRTNPDGSETTYGFYESSRIPEDLVKCAGNLARVMFRLMRSDGDLNELLEPYYRDLTKLVFVSSYFDEKFRFFAARESESVKAEVLCLDPSGVLGSMLRPAKSTLLFSATLSPIDYFAGVTGLDGAKRLELPSPYDRENTCLIAYDSISTTLADRKKTAYSCAVVIAEAVSEKSGNYIVYFPSYDYMRRVCRIFADIAPGCAIVMQKQSMNLRERDKFLELFRDKSRGPIVGFCVLGGMFSEGIDLAGESLIGAIIVGTGMPQLSAERNIIAAYYDEKNGGGRDYAYIYPGMNKVLQAAGRVIRSENDRGVILLIDERFGEPQMKMMIPPHMRHIKYTGDIESMKAILSSFWNGSGK